MTLESLLQEVVKNDASDLHLSVAKPPTLRIHGKLTPIGEQALAPEIISGLVQELLSEEQRKLLSQELEIDSSYSLKDNTRFRVNVYHQSGNLSVALRLIPAKIRTIEELNLPPIVKDFTKYSQGFVLVVGPTGHGKSTVMASLIDIINHSREEHIITVEDPVEYVFQQDKCIVSQREVGKDTKSFKRALRSVLREDPDVIMIGEMRDYESIAAAITAAETGHLVFASLHTNTAAQTIDRIIDSFPSHQQDQVRAQLASILLGVISRRLIPKTSGGLTSAAEVLLVNSAVRNLIREGKNHQIDLVIETSSGEGMISLNRSLAELVKNKEITLDQAVIYSNNIEELKNLVK